MDPEIAEVLRQARDALARTSRHSASAPGGERCAREARPGGSEGGCAPGDEASLRALLDRLDAVLARTAAGPAAGASGLEQRVRELTREVALHDEFLSTLGHELRNPLSPIFMQAEYLLDALRRGEQRALSREWLVSQLESFCRRLKKFIHLLERLMDMSRMSAGQVHLELEEVDLTEVVREVSAGFERELAAARSELRLELPARLVGVWDRMRVEQIVTNLLSNAIRYGAGRPIEVKVGGDLQQIELTVKDRGIGIAEEDRERIFQRFERAGKKRASGGFGIGLWTVRQSCLAMGGHLSLRSQPGAGSEFSVALPRVTEKESLP